MNRKTKLDLSTDHVTFTFIISFTFSTTYTESIDYPCDEIVTRIAERESVCVVERENRCGARTRNRITEY